jgi:hypothetical protein
VTPAQAFACFSNLVPITVAALHVLARAVDRRAPADSQRGAGSGAQHAAVARPAAVPTAAASSFFNNTPIVALLASQVTDWVQRRGISRSRFLCRSRSRPSWAGCSR